jgi:predicted ATPase
MIKEIHIQNFKSIRDVRVDLTPVTVLIGRSGAGKSNFIRAIRFVRNYLVDPGKAVQIEGGWNRIFPFGAKEDLHFSIRFKIPGYESDFSYQVVWQAHPHTADLVVSEERLLLGGNVIFGRSGKQWEAWPDARPKPNVQPVLYISSFPTVTEAVLAFTALTSGIGWHDFPADVFLSSARDEKSQTKGLADSASNYLDVLRDLTQNLQSQHSRRQILARIRQINPSVCSLELDSIIKPTRIVVTHEVGNERIPLELSQESDGFRRYYAHLLALYQFPSKQLLMFEEPENGIYPGALQNLAEEFRSAFEQERGQVLLTTQSPALLDGFDPDSIRVVEVDDNQSTRIGRLEPAQLQAVKDHLLVPGELLTVDQARTAGT